MLALPPFFAPFNQARETLLGVIVAANLGPQFWLATVVYCRSEQQRHTPSVAIRGRGANSRRDL